MKYLKEILFVLLVLGVIFFVGLECHLHQFSASNLASPKLMADMDREYAVLDRIKATVMAGDDCVPVRVGGTGKIDIEYLACTDSAFKHDGESFQVTENLTVPQGIARRVHFWRRVYSLWSNRQYVIHAADYPEVVLEIQDSSRIDGVGDKNREKMMKPWLTERRHQYQQILYKLATLTKAKGAFNEANLSPTERRVYHAFDHITDKDKFMTASQSIRVQRGQREYIVKGLEVAPKYLPYTELEFKKQGLMPELARLAFIESSFNLQALSKVGASGVYQVMPETGKDYLVVNSEIDERNDPIKASRAAAKLLAMDYKILGQWPLAITAYNHGVGGIARAMRESGSSDIVTLINNYNGFNFGFASKNFYAGFLGMLASLHNAAKVFPEVKPVPPLQFDLAKVGGLTLDEVKHQYRLTNFNITSLNPDITRGFMHKGGKFPARYVLKVPAKAERKSAMKLAMWTP